MILTQQRDGIQDVVSQAEKVLPKHKHIKFNSQTAILEFKCGNPERGRSMFENILRNNPKRTDLWSVYLDQVNLLLPAFQYYFFYCLKFKTVVTYSFVSTVAGNSTWR